MKENRFLKALLQTRESEVQRLREDQKRLTENCIGTEETIDLITGKQRKPRAMRDWENNHARW